MDSACLVNIMKDCGIDMIRVLFIFIFALALIFLAVSFAPKGKYINCGISEISPDFTNEMRQMCRQLRGTKF